MHTFRQGNCTEEFTNLNNCKKDEIRQNYRKKIVMQGGESNPAFTLDNL